MQNNKKNLTKSSFRYVGMHGFTLIELLVVVLIIGILSAIAIPQFQTAIDKSRYAALMPLAKSVANAQESYYMAVGNYSPDLAYLDVQLPNSPVGDSADIGDGTSVEISKRTNYKYVKISKNTLENNYIIYQDQSSNFPSEIHCEAEKNNTRAERLCVSLGGQKIAKALTKGYETYVLEGAGTDTFNPEFVDNWQDAGIAQGTIDVMIDAMTLVKEIRESRQRYYQEHGRNPSWDEMDIDVPNNLRSDSFNGADYKHPDTYIFSCNWDSCIANTANSDLPRFEFSTNGVGECMTGGGKSATADSICNQMSITYDWTDVGGYHRYYITDFDEL